MTSLDAIVKNTHDKQPVVHFITNYVTANDCANMTLAAGALPIMADDIAEVEAIVGQASALVLNIGTLTQRTVASMLAAGKKANRQHIPIILDPVGVGASALRSETVAILMRELNFTIIKGNISEIKFLASGIASTSGVDAGSADIITEDTLDNGIDFARKCSKIAGAIIAITGPVDIVADAQNACIIRNGHPLMAKITGTGCMLGGLIGAYVAANPTMPLFACVAAVSALGICGERAYEKLAGCKNGLGSYRVHLLDAMASLDGACLNAKQKITQISSI